MEPSGESAEFEFDFCVVGGCGHVGLPLAIVMAHRELRVAIDDIDTSAIQTVRAGRMPFMEEKAELLLGEVVNKNLMSTMIRRSSRGHASSSSSSERRLTSTSIPLSIRSIASSSA